MRTNLAKKLRADLSRAGRLGRLLGRELAEAVDPRLEVGADELEALRTRGPTVRFRLLGEGRRG